MPNSQRVGGRYVIDPKNGKRRPAGKEEAAPRGTIIKPSAKSDKPKKEG